MWTSNLWIPLVALPLAFAGCVALILSMQLAEVQRDDSGHPTKGGKHLVRSRLFLSLNCGSYILVLIASGLRGSHEYAFVFWNRYKLLFLSLAIFGAVSAILAALHGFRAQGRRISVLQISTTIVAIASTFGTLIFPYGD